MAKGPSFERWFCDRLSAWWSGSPDASVFWRTANSGGRATVRGRKGKKTGNHHGDVCAIDPSGNDFLKVFCVELKRGYNRHTLQDLLDRSDKKIVTQVYEKWVEKAETCREAAGALHWMIVVKRDGREPLVMMPVEAFNSLGFDQPKQSMTVDTSLWGEWITVVCVKLSWFFDTVRTDTIREIAKEKTP